MPNNYFSDNFIQGIKLFFKGKKILITGGAGYLATNLIRMLKEVDCHIIRIDRPQVHFEEVFGKPKIENIVSDVRGIGDWVELLEGTDIVFHFAAQTSVYWANDNVKEDLEINCLPMISLLESCRKHSYKPVILFSSTVTVSGIPKSLPVDEKHPNMPITIYDLHKLLAEEYLKCYIRLGIVQGVILRLANIYGPGPKSSNSDRGILNLMIRKALAGEKLTIYGKGQYLRDYVYIDDVAFAFLCAAAKIDKVNGQHLIIGTGKSYTIAQAIKLVAKRVKAKTGRSVELANIEPPCAQSPIEERNFKANSQRFINATGWKPRYSLINGINNTIEAFL